MARQSNQKHFLLLSHLFTHAAGTRVTHSFKASWQITEDSKMKKATQS